MMDEVVEVVELNEQIEVKEISSTSRRVRVASLIQKGFCFRQGICSPIRDLNERLLLEECDLPATLQEGFFEAPVFDEVDIQALAHVVELTRKREIDSLKFAQGGAKSRNLCGVGLKGVDHVINSGNKRIANSKLYERDEKTLKFKRVQESSRKDIERAFEVLQVTACQSVSNIVKTSLGPVGLNKIVVVG
ncbi:CTLH LisH motif-containing protein [Tanacetum coccineum]